MDEVSGGNTKKRGGGSTVSVHAEKAKSKAAPKATGKVYAKVWNDLETFNGLAWEEKLKKMLSNQNGHCVAKNITLEQFNTRVNGGDGAGCFRMEFVKEKGEATGKSWIYELPDPAHENTAGEVQKEILRSLGIAAFDDFDMGAAPRCEARGDSVEPDGYVRARQKPGQPKLPVGHPGAADKRGNRYPNIIVEVALSETTEHVQEKAFKWLNACTDPNYSVQQVIVIKIGDKECKGQRTHGAHSMRAWRYEQQWTAAAAAEFATANADATLQDKAEAVVAANSTGANGNPINPVESYEFGIPNHGVANGATAVGQMVLQIPVASFYHPNAVPVAFAAIPNIIIDLYRVRTAIEAAL